MKKSSENTAVNATAFPEQVSVAMAEIAENMQEGLLALAVGAGLQVMQTLMEADVTALAGPKGRHDPPPQGTPRLAAIPPTQCRRPAHMPTVLARLRG